MRWVLASRRAAACSAILVHLGFNQDLAGRQVFDGILPVVAGSRRTCVNWQFAQAGRYSRQHEDHSYGDDQFPFSYPTLSDPISGRSGGILQRARDAGVCPKVLHLDTESDFWQARSSLIATDTSGADIAMPDEVRVYTVSGVPHAPFRPLTKPVMQLPGNRLGYGAFMRALLVALFEWVEHGTAPPDSRFPSRAAGTLVPLAEARATFPRLPEVNFPNRPERAAAARPFGRAAEREHGLPGVRAIDGCRRQRSWRHPPSAAHRTSGHACRLVAARERLWRRRPVHHPGFDDSVRRDRSRKAARGDPRPSLETRYASRDAWAARLAAAVDRLVAERLLLAEDGDRLAAAARESWDVYQAL